MSLPLKSLQGLLVDLFLIIYPWSINPGYLPLTQGFSTSAPLTLGPSNPMLLEALGVLQNAECHLCPLSLEANRPPS